MGTNESCLRPIPVFASPTFNAMEVVSTVWYDAATNHFLRDQYSLTVSTLAMVLASCF